MTVDLEPESVAKKIVEIFEEERSHPGTDYDPNCLIHYLLPNSTGTRDIKNSFSGMRRFNRFINHLQSEFSVCFSNKDLDTIHALDAFTRRIIKLKNTPRSSLTVLANRIRGHVEWNLVVMVNLVLGILIMFSFLAPFLIAPMIIITVLVDVLLYRFYAREKSYYLSLQKQIESG